MIHYLKIYYMLSAVLGLKDIEINCVETEVDTLATSLASGAV